MEKKSDVYIVDKDTIIYYPPKSKLCQGCANGVFILDDLISQYARACRVDVKSHNGIECPKFEDKPEDKKVS